MANPKVSVIVPAYNCQATIAQTIKALLSQDYSDEIEVLVVDDGSTDKTAEVVRSFCDVQYVHQDNAGPATARNRGAKQAKGEIIFFTDSDCIPHTDWVSKMAPVCQGEVGAVAGSYGIANEKSLLSRCVWQEICFRHKRLPDEVRVFGSYNVCLQRKVLDEVGGFDEGYRHASGEDNDLSYKIIKAGHKIRFQKDALVDHHHPSRLGKYLKEQYRHGFWRAKMYLHHPDMAKGDDYTFWKDSFEAGAMLLFFPAFLLGALGFELGKALSISILILIVLLELAFSILICRNIIEYIYFTGVMTLRAAARALGLLMGALKSLVFFGKI